MKPEQLERFRRLLETRRDDTLESLADIADEGRRVQTDSPKDLGEYSVANFSREFLFQQSAQMRRLLRNIEAALKRINEGRFGECITCGKTIDDERLEALPFAANCRRCQEKLESKGAPD